jgi:FkbM family methyltransferase
MSGVPLPRSRVVPTDVGEMVMHAECAVTTSLDRWRASEHREVQELKRRLRPGGTFLDVGAHVGYHVLSAARVVGPGGRVIGIEADPANFALLAENASRSRMPWIEVIHAAAWSEKGELAVVRSLGNTGNTRVKAMTNGARPEHQAVAPASRVDDLLEPDVAIDVVMLDTQGTEHRALEGMRSMLERCAPMVLLEFWPLGIEWQGDRPVDVLAYLRGLGFELRVLGTPDHSSSDTAVFRAVELTQSGSVTLLLEPTRAARPRRPVEVQLSICIPTHAGRANQLAQTLASVGAQMTPDLVGRVEAVVSDGGDDPQTAKTLAADFGGVPVRHRHHPTDRGFAWHLLDAVEHAGGAWCWPMSSDDAFEPGALRRVLEAIAADPGLAGLSVSIEPYDPSLTMPTAVPYRFIYPPDETRARTYTQTSTLLGDLGVLLSYFPSHLVRREPWLRAVEQLGGAERPSYYFPHVDVIGRIVADGGRWRWSGRRLVRDRVGADSWTPRRFGGVVARYWCAILRDLDSCYCRALGAEHASVSRSLMERWRLGIAGNRMLLNYKAQETHTVRDDIQLARTLTRLYWRQPGFWRSSAPALALPHSLARRALGVLDGPADEMVRTADHPPRSRYPWTQSVTGSARRAADLRAEVAQVGFWWHSIDLGNGVVTPGRRADLATMEADLADLHLPELVGHTVLDIGTWDGFFAFAAERMGAASVVALDHYVWERDHSGSPFAPPGYQLPGRRGFDLARAALGSRVDPRHLDFFTGARASLDRFDVVLFLGVLQHLEDPLDAMQRVHAVTGELAVIETAATEWPGHEQLGLVELYPHGELGGDRTSLWAPSSEGLRELCLGAGFSEVTVVRGPPPPGEAAIGPIRYRAIVHARP